MPNLSSLLEGTAEAHPDRTAVVLGSTRLTYAQVDAAANQVANLLVSRGIEPGDKVALSCPNLPYFPIVYYGILKAGATVVPLNVLLRGAEVAYHLQDSDATMLVAWEGFAAEAASGFNETETCHTLLIVNAPGSQNLPEGSNVKSFNALMGPASHVFDMVQTMP